MYELYSFQVALLIHLLSGLETIWVKRQTSITLRSRFQGKAWGKNDLGVCSCPKQVCRKWISVVLKLFNFGTLCIDLLIKNPIPGVSATENQYGSQIGGLQPIRGTEEGLNILRGVAQKWVPQWYCSDHGTARTKEFFHINRRLHWLLEGSCSSFCPY